jgi:diguanylate cyclase (GGDEF)-like protein/PAS domain S-box-containing protein
MIANHNINIQRLLDDMHTFVAILDADGTILFVNNTPLNAINMTLDEVLGVKFWNVHWWLYSDVAMNQIKNDVEFCAKGNSLVHEIQFATADGTLVWLEYSMHPIFDDDHNIVQLIPEGRIITEQKQAEEKLRKLNNSLESKIKQRTQELEETVKALEKVHLLVQEQAKTDALTGLANRRAFKEYAENKIAQAKRSNTALALLYIDLDGFKHINDEISHHVGDIVLSTLGDRFKNFSRKNELIARLGGDEFCMIVYDYKTRAELENIARRLIRQCTLPIEVDGMEVKFGMSVGIACYPENSEELDKLVNKADGAMYKVKSTTKGSFAFAH